MSAVEIVRTNSVEQCHASLCHDSGCWLTMANAPDPNVLLYLEHPRAPIDRSKPHCDFLFVGGGENNTTELVAPIELTTSEHNARKFKRQLQAGASLAEKLIPSNIKVRFRPIAVHGKENIRKAERKRLLNPTYHVEFRCKKTPFKLVRCGSPLSEALNVQ